MKKEIEYINNYLDEKIDDEELKADCLICGIVKFTFAICQDKEIQMRTSTLITSAYFTIKKFIEKVCVDEENIKEQQERLNLIDKSMEYITAFLEGQEDIDKVNIFLHLLQDEINRKDIDIETKEAFKQDCDIFMDKVLKHLRELENANGRKN